MADSTAPPQQYPDIKPQAESAKNSILTREAQSTMDSIKNSQTVQSIANGPVADKARAEAETTKSQLSSLASSRTTPAATTATGQPLTHYHSFFYNLLAWENPRATALSYAGIVTFILATRYVPLVRYGLRVLCIVLGITASAEVAGRFLFDQGVASKLKPNKYYTIPRETLESMIEDATELINFFVIEFQRIIFAENVLATLTAFVTLLTTYLLIKITPPWGLALLFTTVAYFTPLVYISNKALIDEHLNNASDVINQQTKQVRDLASQHTNKAVEMSQSAIKDYSSKASEMMGSAKKTAVVKGVVSQETASKLPGPTPEVKKEDFPAAPDTDLPAPVPAMDDHGAPLEAKLEQELPLMS